LPFLAVDIYLASNIFPIDYGRSAAIGTVLFWISVMGVTAYQLASSAARRFVTVTARGYRIRLVPLRAWRTPALALVVVYVLAAIVLPYLAILFACFTRFMSASLLNAPWTLVNVTGALGAPEVMDSIEHSASPWA
jgi:iron(III) transport system permease protein